MFTKEDIIKDIHIFIQQCNQLNIFFDKVILFGSYATNQAKQFSDIDLLLVSKQFSYNKLKNIMSIATPLRQNIWFEPHPYPTEYFNQKKDPIIIDALKNGINIV